MNATWVGHFVAQWTLTAVPVFLCLEVQAGSRLLLPRMLGNI